METAQMGRVTVTATMENFQDLWEVKKGTRKPEEVRRVEVDNALVDTGAKMLSLPIRLVHELGLEFFDKREAVTSGGRKTFDVYRAVQLTVLGRRCLCDVAALPDDCPVILGYLPLEQLDFVVDPNQQRIVTDPFHGGEHLIDMF